MPHSTAVHHGAPAEPDGRGKEMGEEALSAAPPRLLSDDEVRHFIANG